MSEFIDNRDLEAVHILNPRIDRAKLKKFVANERADFISARPNGFSHNSKQEVRQNGAGFWNGVPQHWMLDWPTPFPLYIAKAKDVKIKDIDGNELIDLCLGDTGAMFGHSPDAIETALKTASENGLTAMLPSQTADWVGAKLSEIFGLPYWQMALSASDANRFALRVARAATARQKILVFDGCYHGAVDETTVQLDKNGKTIAKPSLWGSAFNPAINTVCVPFNEIELLAVELKTQEIACVIMEPALTNCGIVPPIAGFLEEVQKLCEETDTLLLMDETHTLSTGYGGYSRAFGLKPDIFVAGKAIAGGVPCAIWGFNAKVKDGLEIARSALPSGHSGVGTTLGGSLLALTALKASLENLVTPETYAGMIESAAKLENELKNISDEFALDWSIIRIGARLEIVFSKEIPKNADEMRCLFDYELEEAIHLGLINRGFLVTPFHNMLLAGPNLSQDTPVQYGNAMRQIIKEII